MKLNAAAEMMPGWPEFEAASLVPTDQARGYQGDLCRTGTGSGDHHRLRCGLAAAGTRAQGEFAGCWSFARITSSAAARDIVLIRNRRTDQSAAPLAGMKIVIVACDAQGTWTSTICGQGCPQAIGCRA
jgi:glycine cleavage system protein P-like pyridoxal-binding family